MKFYQKHYEKQFNQQAHVLPPGRQVLLAEADEEVVVVAAAEGRAGEALACGVCSLRFRWKDFMLPISLRPYDQKSANVRNVSAM